MHGSFREFSRMNRCRRWCCEKRSQQHPHLNASNGNAGNIAMVAEINQSSARFELALPAGIMQSTARTSIQASASGHSKAMLAILQWPHSTCFTTSYLYRYSYVCHQNSCFLSNLFTTIYLVRLILLILLHGPEDRKFRLTFRCLFHFCCVVTYTGQNLCRATISGV